MPVKDVHWCLIGWTWMNTMFSSKPSNLTIMEYFKNVDEPSFNAEMFCLFENSFYSEHIIAATSRLNPWINIYEDPNEVENYEFLFMPFYFNSENFRNKAKEYIQNLDITSLDRSDLW